jgi:hypothetical protein
MDETTECCCMRRIGHNKIGILYLTCGSSIYCNAGTWAKSTGYRHSSWASFVVINRNSDETHISLLVRL